MAEYRLGDLVFTRFDSWIGRLIRLATRAPGEGPTWANHVGIIVLGGSEDPIALDTDFRVRAKPLSEFKGEIEVWRHTGLHPMERGWIAAKAAEYQGRPYGWGKVLLHGLDALLTKLIRAEVFLFRRLAVIDRYPICSWIPAFAYHRVTGYTFGVDPAWADPDWIYDYINNSLLWERIYPE